jgi:DNA-binding PadR family transcriptional regulator
MAKHRDDWGLGDLLDGVFGLGDWGRRQARWRGRGRRQQMFESGELRLVILRLLKEQPRHGYDIIKALEERLGGCYTPSAGAVYPTLQLLEDQGLVRVVEEEGRKVYHLTPAGETLLGERSGELEDIIERVRQTVRDVAGGARGELNRAFAQLASRTFREAYRRGSDDPSVRRVADLLRRTADAVEQEWRGGAPAEGGGPT